MHPLRDREVVDSNPGCAIPKALKWYQWLPCLVLNSIRQALTSLLLTNITQLTLQHLQKVPMIINVCIHRGGPYGRLAIMLNTLSSLNIEISIIIIIFIKTCNSGGFMVVLGLKLVYL